MTFHAMASRGTVCTSHYRDTPTSLCEAVQRLHLFLKQVEA